MAKTTTFNWQKYIGQYDMIYEMPSRVWQDGTPLGNGSLAALASEPFNLEWTINKNDVWDYRHPKFKRHTLEELRAMIAAGKGTGQDYIKEMSKENIEGVGLYPCPKTCGQLRIRFGLDSSYAPGHRISKRLGLYDATLHTNLDKHLSHPRVSSFICAEENVLVIQVREVSAMTAFSNKVDLHRVPDAHMPPVKKGARKDTIWLEQVFHDGFSYVMMARVVPRGGGQAYRDLFRRTVQEQWWNGIEPSKEIESKLEGEYAVAPVKGDFDVYLTVVTSLESKSPLKAAEELLARAASEGAASLHAKHCRWWADFWTKSYVGLSDLLLEQLWYMSLYNLATVLRGTPVGGLCGLWYGPMDTPSQILPWLGYYTNDYNMQLPVMPVWRVNHPELADGTFRTLLMQLPQAKRNARELYDMPGAYYPLSTDPTGADVTDGSYRLCQNSGPWWSMLLWWHYLYTGDVGYLREVAYPIMREVAEFFSNYMRWYPEEGRYHLEISQQPELMYIKYPDPSDTLALVKYAFDATIKAARMLKCDESLSEKCRHVLEHFPDYPRQGDQLLCHPGVRPDHANLYTLRGLYQCGEFDPEIAPEWYKICEAELKKADFWTSTYACNKGRLVGWTGIVHYYGMPACWLGLKKMAWSYLMNLLKTNVKPNGLISHNGAILANSALSEKNIELIPDVSIYHSRGPEPVKAAEWLNGRMPEYATENLDCRDTMFPVLEGPADYLHLLGEMLLQSHNGILRPFACLPDDQDSEFHDLRAEGPTLVSASRKKGKVIFIRLKALAPVSWKLKNPWPGKAVYIKSSRSKKIVTEAADKYVVLNLAAGEEMVVSQQKGNLNFASKLHPRTGETACPRSKVFNDGMLVWLGKPEPSEYYASLEAARKGVPSKKAVTAGKN